MNFLTDLIWIGNTLYPRWLVFVAIAGCVVAVSFVIAAIIVAVQELTKWIFRALLRAIRGK